MPDTDAEQASSVSASADQSALVSGFLLTRASFDRRTGPEIHYWLATQFGPVKAIVRGERPVFFVLQQELAEVERVLAHHQFRYQQKELALTTFSDQAVAGLYFNRIADHQKAAQLLVQHQLAVLESDLRMHDRFLMERFINANLSVTGQWQQQSGYWLVDNAKLKPAEVEQAPAEPAKLTMLSLDVECSMQGDLYSVALQGEGLSGPCHRVVMIGMPEQSQLDMIWVPDEKALLRVMVEQINNIDPDIIIGWNVIGFDCRLLVRRAKKYGMGLAIGRDGGLAHWREARGDSNQGFININGRVVIDGVDGLKTATYMFESFSLENVSRELLGRGKKIEDVGNRVEHITHDFKHNKTKLAAYNLEDCQLVTDIFEQTQLLDFLKLRSQLTGLEIDRIGGSVAAFTNLYLPKLHRAGYVAPNLPEGGGLASPGGYVMSSKPGLYKNVLVLDFKSLYPSIIRTFKIDPMGLIEGLKHSDDAIPGFRGAMFARQDHFLPDIIESLWRQRDQAKKQKDGPRSQAIKILMNSFYGVLGSGGCRFYDTRLASSITMRGHEIMQHTAEFIEQAGYQVIYGDTDSTFVWLDGEYTEQQAQTIGKTLAKQANQFWQDKIKQEFDLPCLLELEFETHYQRFLMPTIRGSESGSKKRYAGLIDNGEQYKIIFKGLETVRSDWTELARQFQTRLFELVFADENPAEYVRVFVEDTLNGKHDDKLVYRKRLRRKLVDYRKNVPPHVKAARMADEKNKQQGLPLKYQNKAWIKYLVTVSGPEPKEYLTSPLDYQHYIEKQLRPIADGILPFINQSFSSIVDRQLSLF